MNKNKFLPKNKIASNAPDKKEDQVKKVKLTTEDGTTMVSVDDILFAKAEDHKVKVLAVILNEHKWCERTGSLKQFFAILPAEKFECINKFYVINWQFLPMFKPKQRIITFSTGFSFELKHHIKASVFKDKL